MKRSERRSYLQKQLKDAQEKAQQSNLDTEILNGKIVELCGGKPGDDAIAHVEELLETVRSISGTADTAISELFKTRESLYVPGVWQCRSCHFVLTRTSISATTGDFGTTAADREDSEPCPNARCNGAMLVRVTWEQRCKELMADAMPRYEEIGRLREALEHYAADDYIDNFCAKQALGRIPGNLEAGKPTT